MVRVGAVYKQMQLKSKRQQAAECVCSGARWEVDLKYCRILSNGMRGVLRGGKQNGDAKNSTRDIWGQEGVPVDSKFVILGGKWGIRDTATPSWVHKPPGLFWTREQHQHTRKMSDHIVSSPLPLSCVSDSVSKDASIKSEDQVGC